MLSADPKDWRLLINRPELFIPQNRIIALGWQFSAQHLIVQISTSNQRDSWQFGGTLWASTLVNGYPTRFFSRELDLYAQEFLEIPDFFEGKYSLVYRAPKYFSNVRIKIWQYQGEIPEAPVIVQNNQIIALLRELLGKEESEEPPDNPDAGIAYMLNF